jgi:alanyl-tRNA synthetase
VATNTAAREAGLKAGSLLRTGVSAMGGKGGGKDDMAQGGGGDPTRTGEALAALRSAIEAEVLA